MIVASFPALATSQTLTARTTQPINAGVASNPHINTGPNPRVTLLARINCTCSVLTQPRPFACTQGTVTTIRQLFQGNYTWWPLPGQVTRYTTPRRLPAHAHHPRTSLDLYITPTQVRKPQGRVSRVNLRQAEPEPREGPHAATTTTTATTSLPFHHLSCPLLTLLPFATLLHYTSTHSCRFTRKYYIVW